ncbi:hypothetical protein [Alterisphingorhabdus coralli]|uniref:Secreted protein n=1 Tax=Alterisphingorhabdus coralli TaxID=3071408 RepID=A0AA97F6I5_9SPHN|nr:hypothetical protein [Parasphingorhabdus sp. SCSIO 66989]WOE74863.1 hypothetical protein RB602_13620 [Parasphingorhabdus sp. SCSIO 66989]
MPKGPLIVAATFGLIAAPIPAWAQSEVPADVAERIVQKPVYGDDECEPSVDADEIVVCVRFDESERYRIPPNLRGDPNDPKNQAWALRVQSLETVGATGTNSCSPVGVGGFTGCTTQLINNYYSAQRNNADVQAGRLIEQARQERLSRIDEEAALVEAAELERQSELEAYRKQREAEEAAAAQAAGSDVQLTPDNPGSDDSLTVPPTAEDAPPS